MNNDNMISSVEEIDIEAINIQSLPSLFVLKRDELPEVSSVYFVVNQDNDVEYIGRTKNLRKRWKAHHLLNLLGKDNSLRIAWLKVDNQSLLSEIEKTLIKRFNPNFNRVVKEVKEVRVDCRYLLKEETLMELSFLAVTLGYSSGIRGEVFEMLDAIASGELVVIPKKYLRKRSRKEKRDF